MLPYRDSRLTIVALVIFFVIVAGYAYFEAQGLLWGPSITVSSSVEEVSDPLVIIQGQTTHISSLTMDGQQISVTESGQFQEPYLLSPGDNKITLVARDAYGRSTQKVVEIVYQAPAGSTQTASTTPATAAASSTPASSTPNVAPGQ